MARPPRKARSAVPLDTSAEVMYLSDRTCCVCQVPGKRLQIHHIDENPANHEADNLAPLCFDCHDDTQIRGGFGRTLDAAQVRRARLDWFERVAARRKRADDLTVQAMVGDARSRSATSLLGRPGTDALPIPDRFSLAAYLHALPEIRRAAYAMRDAMPGDSTVDMVNSTTAVIDVMREALIRLASYYPEGHFEGGVEQFVDDQLHRLYSWHGHIAATYGHGNSGTIVGPVTSARVLDTMERMVAEMVMMLGPWDHEGLSALNDWRDSWDAAGPGRGHGDRDPGEG